MIPHQWPGLKKKKPRKIVDIDAEEISLVDSAANKKTFAVIKAAAAETSGDGDGPTIERILEAFLGPDYPGADLSAFKQSVANLDQFFDTVPENLKDSIKVLVWCILEAMAGGFELKEADEEAAVDEGTNGKGKNGGVKKSASLFPTLGFGFLKNFMFGSRLEKWQAEELQKQADADEDDGPDPEPAVRRPIRKSLPADDVPDDEDAEAAAQADVDRHSNLLGGFGFGISPSKKKTVKKSADIQDGDDDKILWPSLSGGQF